MEKVLVIAGLTASGKSSLGIELAKKYNGEVISADSVAVYKDLDIGSAKLSMDDRQGINHHLIDVYDYHDGYNVAKFQEEARALIKDISARGKLPIVVGGTGLYINALLYDYRFDHEDIEEVEYSETNEELMALLVEKDPLAAESIHLNNRKRIIRALERPDSSDDKPEFDKEKALYDGLVFFLQGDRKLIYDRINQRVDHMFEIGLLEEVDQLVKKDKEFFKQQSTQSIGYREFEAYYNQDQSLDETKDLIKRNTRRFAKRQITWFKHQTKNITMDIFSDNFLEDVNKEVSEWLDKDRLQ